MLSIASIVATADGSAWMGWWPVAAVLLPASGAAAAWWQWIRGLAPGNLLGRHGGPHDSLQATLAGMLDPLTLMKPVRDTAGRVVDFTYAVVNPAACAWIGIDRDRLVGRRLLELFPEVESTGLMRPFADTAVSGRPVIIEDFPFPLRGVGVRWMDIRAVRANGWVCFVWRDVTARHEAVERVARSESQFRLLAENSTDVVIRIGADDRVLWISPSVTPVLGWLADAIVGRAFAELLADDDSRGRYARDKAGAAAGQGGVCRIRIRTAAGTPTWVEVHTSPWRSAEGFIDGMVASLRVVEREVRMSEALERRARTDDLTGLLNRPEVLERLTAILARDAAGVAVLWCDIDRFKSLNDAHGHAAGDAVLAALGERIGGSLRTAADLAGRIGGDELVVVLGGMRDLADATARAETLRRRAAEPIACAGGTVTATLSIGVAMPRGGEGLDGLLARADDAMYRAKAGGRNRVVAVP